MAPAQILPRYPALPVLDPCHDDGRLPVTPRMTNHEALPERVDRIEQKLDSLAASIDRRFDDVDRRFNEVTDALVEQRQYTEFAFERLDKKVISIDTKLDEVLRILRR